MRTVVLLAVWMSVLSCGDDKVRKYAEEGREERNMQSDRSPPNVDPFVEGNSYRFVMTTASTPGLEKSSAAVEVFIREFVSPDPSEEDDVADTGTDTGTDTDTDSSTRLATDAEVQLSWECGDKQKGDTKVEMHRLDKRLNVTFKELPALKRISDSIKCKITATLDTTRADGERVIATGSHEFYIEIDVLYPALRLHDVEITANPGDPNKSDVAFKVSLIRQGKVVVQGDPVFDEKVDVALTWACNDTQEMSKSPTPTDLTIAAGKAEATTKLSLPKNTELRASGYACMITATAKIEGYEHDVEGKKKLWIEGKDLQVAVTSVSRTSLSYVVMKRYQQLSGNVKLSLVNCAGITISSGDNLVSSQGSVVLTGTSTSSACKLKAQVMNSDNEVSREGMSRPFSVT